MVELHRPIGSGDDGSASSPGNRQATISALGDRRVIAPLVDAAIRTVRTETAALQALQDDLSNPHLSNAFEQSTEVLARARGRIVVSGMGKSGHIARKVASTFSSVGVPAFYLHPSEASHGDLGMITTDDVVLVFSWSGETVELSDVITFARRLDIPLIAVTSAADSSLADQATVCLTLPKVKEACPNSLAPTSSTIVQLAIGDAFAVALMEMRGFSAEDFRVFHPRGTLAARLLTVADIMSVGPAIPKVLPDATILDAMIEMSRKRFGITAVVDHAGELVGAFTDGDLRRSVTSTAIDAPVRGNMTESPRFVNALTPVSEALETMKVHMISQLFVCEESRLVGIVHMHEILKVAVL